MSKTIKISVRDKIAVKMSNIPYTCGNSDFVINFDFDAEWDEFSVKTARFIKDDRTYQDQVFQGNKCPVPVLYNTNKVRVGVFAGNLHTSTPAIIPANKGILCVGGSPEAPSEDVYAQIMEMLNNSGAVGGGGGLVVVYDTGDGTANYSPDEIKEFFRSGKYVVFFGDEVDDAIVYQLRFLDPGTVIFEATAGSSETTIYYRHIYVQQDKKIYYGRADVPTSSGGHGGGASVEPAEDDLPKVFFSGPLQQTKDEAVVSFSYRSKTLSFDCYAEIKAQGNSTMQWPKKNQTIKLYQDAACTEKFKVDFKGWGRQNKFVIKANWRDLTHVRDIVSVRLEGDCMRSNPDFDELPELLKNSPNLGGVDGFPVVVYADGVYQGRYMWNIPKDAWMANMDDDLDSHCILCSEDYNSSCFRAAANINGNDWTDEIHDSVPTSIKTRWNEVINFVMNSSDEEFMANLDSYIKVSTLIDRHLMGLLSCDFDGYGKNQLYLTYDGEQWYAGRYDKDGTWGNYWSGDSMLPSDYGREQYEDFTSTQSDGRGNLLFIRLEQLFRERLQTRWAELKDGPLSIPNIINRFRELYDITPPYVIEEDYAATTANGAFTGIPNKTTCTIQQIQKFIVERYAWMDQYIAGLSGEDGPDEPDVPDEPVLLYSLPGTTTFDGTNHIDTGVQLFAEDKPFTVVLDWEHTGASAWAVQHTIAHCVRESSPYPGLIAHYTTGGIELTMNQGQRLDANPSIDGYNKDSLNRLQVIYTKDANGNLTMSRRYNCMGEIYKSTMAGTFVALTQNLLLGCNQDTSGNLSRFAKGVLHECKVYNYALSDEDISAWFDSNSFVLPDVVLWENYSPAGSSFSKSADIYWDSQYLEASMNLTNCTNTNENLLGIGDNIGAWFGYKFQLLYVDASSVQICANAGSAAANSNRCNITITEENRTNFVVRLDKNGLTVNGVQLRGNDFNVTTGTGGSGTAYDDLIAYLIAKNTVQIGSVEGSVRSNATYNYVKVGTV